MNRKTVWLIALAGLVLLVAACGPQMTTPTPAEDVVASGSPAAGSVEASPPATQEDAATSVSVPTAEAPTQEPLSSVDLPVDEDDWHVLGSPDALVTIVEYSEFQ
jgi:protein-disulfide isomerase